MTYAKRTYEPLQFLGKTPGRLFWVPLRTTPGVNKVSLDHTWEENGNRWARTLILRIPFTRWAIGFGVWQDVTEEITAVHDEDAEYATYVAVNGPVDREEWQRARQYVARQGLDPDEEMEMMQMLGIFK